MATFKERLQAVDSSIDKILQDDIKALEEKGIDVPSNAKHSDIPNLINDIEIGHTLYKEANIYGGYVFNNYLKKINLTATKVSFVKNQNPTGNYTDISLNKDGSVKMWANGNEVIISSNEVIKPITGKGMFSYMSTIKQIDFTNFSVESTTDLSNMFQSCSTLSTVNINNWNTENVTNTSYMFSGCSSLTSLNINSWNVEKITDASYMFSSCSGLTSLNLGNWDTKNLYSATSMFSSCSGLTSLNLDNWNTENTGSFGNMFSGCSTLKVLNLKSFKLTSATSIANMFQNCYALTTIYAYNWLEQSHFTISGTSVFRECTNLKGATNFNSSQTDYTMANYTSGYFTNPALAPN